MTKTNENIRDIIEKKIVRFLKGAVPVSDGSGNYIAILKDSRNTSHWTFPIISVETISENIDAAKKFAREVLDGYYLRDLYENILFINGNRIAIKKGCSYALIELTRIPDGKFVESLECSGPDCIVKPVFRDKGVSYEGKLLRITELYDKYFKQYNPYDFITGFKCIHIKDTKVQPYKNFVNGLIVKNSYLDDFERIYLRYGIDKLGTTYGRFRQINDFVTVVRKIENEEFLRYMFAEKALASIYEKIKRLYYEHDYPDDVVSLLYDINIVRESVREKYKLSKVAAMQLSDISRFRLITTEETFYINLINCSVPCLLDDETLFAIHTLNDAIEAAESLYKLILENYSLVFIDWCDTPKKAASKYKKKK